MARITKKRIHQKTAKEYGIDLSLIDSNLRLTPTDRMTAHQKALELALLLRQAGRNARSQRNPAKASRK